MALLFRCPDCGNQVSQQAAACPRCGRVMSGAGSRSAAVMSGFRILMLLGTALAGLAGFLFPPAWILAIVFLVLGVVVKRVA